MIAAGGMCTVTVTFSPGAPGEVKSELTVAVAGGASTGVPLSGTGIRAAVLELTTASHDFGSVPVGVRQGGADHHPGQRRPGDGHRRRRGADRAGRGRVRARAQLSDLPGRRRHLRRPGVLQARPTTGAATATLNATGNPGGMDTATLTGTGVTPADGQHRPDQRDFGTVQVGQNSAPVTFDVTNTGGVATGALTFTIADTEFRIVAGTADVLPGRSWPPGRCAACRWLFSPTSAGTKTSTLTVAGRGRGHHQRHLDGHRHRPGAPGRSRRTTASFGSVAVGQMRSEVPFTVTNAGGDAIRAWSPVMTGSAQFQIARTAARTRR